MKKTSILKKLINSEFPQSGTTQEDWTRAIESGQWKRKIVLGIGSEGYIEKDPVDDPGLFGYGGQGSGKSTSVKGICTTILCASSEVTFMPFVDFSSKGMGDYKQFFKYKDNTCSALFEIEKIVPLMDLLSRELVARGAAFKDIGGANNIYQYEEYYYEKLSRYHYIVSKLKNGKSIDSVDPTEIISFLLNEKSPGGPYKFAFKELDFIKSGKKSLNRDKEIQELVLIFQTRLMFDISDRDYLKYLAEKNILRLSKEQNEAIASVANAGSATTEDLSKLEYTKKFYGAAQIYTVFEEFHNIPNSEQVQFDDLKDTPGSVANQMYNIARTGRSFGINIFAATQKASYKEFPNDLAVGITNIMAHKGPGNGNLELPQDSSKLIKSGHFIHKEGQGRAIYFTDSIMDKLLRKYIKPCKAEMFGPSISDYHEALSGVGAEGMMKTYPLFKIVSNYQVFMKKESKDSKELIPIVERILGNFGFSFKRQLNETLQVRGFSEKEGEKFAVFYANFGGRRGYGDGFDRKKIDQLRNDMKVLGYEKLIVLAFGEDSSLQSLARETGGYYMDLHDMKRAAQILDNREENEKAGIFNELMADVPLSRHVQGDSTDEEEYSDEEEDMDDLISSIKNKRNKE